ncbi:MAG TPA: EF-hand domain-containing protein [Phycisphaerales bacterium]|nr:EF-hand domain-containing protein [Phycisphaerales bacterium]
MNHRNVIIAILTAAGCSATALAQDSTGTSAGLPGDAVGAYTTNTQRLNYVIDMADLFGSWNTKFGIAPLMKTNRTGTTFFNNLQSAAGISSTARPNTVPPVGSYREWFGPGFGVNPDGTKNLAGSPTAAPEVYTQLGAIVADFGTDEGGRNYNGITTAIFGYDTTFPSRLYVSRVVTAVNQPSVGAGDTAQFGLGGVDARGNVAIRADGFGIADTVNGFGSTEVNYFRVNAGQRSGSAINQISKTGGASDAAASVWVDLVAPLDATRASTVAHNTPNILPADLSSSGVARVLGSNFNRNYVFETNSNLVSEVNTHRPGTGDHRGGVHVYPAPLLGGANEVATGGILSQSTAGGGATDSLSIWGIKGDGSVGSAVTITRPLSISDSCDPFTFAPGAPAFENYRSQVAARGGNAQVSLGQTVNFTRVASAMLASSNTATNPYNVIAVYEDDGFSAPFTNGSWKLAAWVDTPNLSGKPIFGDVGNDGIPFTGDAGEFDGQVDFDINSPTYDAPMGRLASMLEVTGGSPVGPSLSSPMTDSAGNIWFTSAVALNKSDQFGTPFTDFDSALIRAVYNPASSCWQLELIVELGDTFSGLNSGTPYQIQFMQVADSNSIASETTWSNMIVAGGWNNQGLCPTRDPRSSFNLGGLVFNAEIVYDVDGNGEFNDPTGGGGDPSSPDQSYQVLMYVGNSRCPADFDGSGFVDTEDYDAFVQQFELGENTADFDCSGFVDIEDFTAFVQAFERGC